jgi:hypothetical protein
VVIEKKLRIVGLDESSNCYDDSMHTFSLFFVGHVTEKGLSYRHIEEVHVVVTIKQYLWYDNYVHMVTLVSTSILPMQVDNTQ